MVIKNLYKLTLNNWFYDFFVLYISNLREDTEIYSLNGPSLPVKNGSLIERFYHNALKTISTILSPFETIDIKIDCYWS